MTALAIDPRLLADVRRYGAADVSACFSCGVCTATCPLVESDGTFPRRLIRYAQVGMRDALLSSADLWACYHCGECSEACPTGADPAGFMAAARRWAIASYDRTGAARALYTRPALGTLILVLLAAFFALFMYLSHGPQDAATLALFRFIPAELIHNVGTVVLIAVFLTGISGVITMARHVATAENAGWGDLVAGRAALAGAARAAWAAIGMESLAQRRFRAAGDEVQAELPLYRRRWLLHALAVWGFLGLLAATLLDYGLELAGIKATGTPVPIWYPVRLLGTVAGTALLYGSTGLIVDRVRRATRAAADSTPSDWTLLVLLWITGVSGFVVEIALYLPEAPAWGYWVFLFHVAVAMELVLLAPFTKLAHAVYRPVALFFLALRPLRAKTAVGSR